MVRTQHNALKPRLPQAGDMLFKPARASACCLQADPGGYRKFGQRFNSSDAMHLYGHGYKLAADMLCQKALDEYSVHTLIFPIVFLYRHYVELSLKETLHDASWFVADVMRTNPTHDLRTLWKNARGILPVVWPEAQPAQIDAVEACITEISEHDPRSMAFRYPFDKEENPHLENLDSIDLRNLRDVMDRVGNFLYCLGEATAQQLEYRTGFDCY
jgi:hypothetical protein